MTEVKIKGKRDNCTTKNASEDHRASTCSTFVFIAMRPASSAASTNSSVNKESASSLRSVSDRGPISSRALPSR